jgi:hypothetical protein
LEAAQLPSHPKWASKKSWNIIEAILQSLQFPAIVLRFYSKKPFFSIV